MSFSSTVSRSTLAAKTWVLAAVAVAVTCLSAAPARAVQQFSSAYLMGYTYKFNSIQVTDFCLQLRLEKAIAGETRKEQCLSVEDARYPKFKDIAVDALRTHLYLRLEWDTEAKLGNITLGSK